MVTSIEIDKNISYLQSTLDTVRKRILIQKRAGYDTYISELLLTYASSYIKMYDASRSKEDYAKCMFLFNEIDKESRIEELRFLEESNE